MTEWVHRLRALSPAHSVFGAGLLKEEANKLERLAYIASKTGLPIYESCAFKLPTNAKQFRDACWRMTKDPRWRLVVRISKCNTGEVQYRGLNISAKQAMDAIRQVAKGEFCIATISRYKPPARSGTLWIGGGQARMEFAFGPHTLLSKGRAERNELIYCTFGNFIKSVQYSSNDESIRRMLFAAFQKSTRLTLGCSLMEAVECDQTVYAEFHWHKDIGMRFIECSYAPVWGCVGGVMHGNTKSKFAGLGGCSLEQARIRKRHAIRQPAF